MVVFEGSEIFRKILGSKEKEDFDKRMLVILHSALSL